MKKRILNNKGVSPLIATVLLVGAVMVIGVVVWLLFRGIIVGNVEKVDCSATEELALDVSAECTCTNNNAYDIKLRNNGQEKIDGLLVVSYYDGGDAIGSPATFLSVKPAEEGTVSYNNPGDTCPTEVEVIPAVVKEANKKKKLVVCTDKLQKVECSG